MALLDNLRELPVGGEVEGLPERDVTPQRDVGPHAKLVLDFEVQDVTDARWELHLHVRLRPLQHHVTEAVVQLVLVRELIELPHDLRGRDLLLVGAAVPLEEGEGLAETSG